MTKLLSLSLGPVQGFIGEARRTRDYWGGSFLLSWLTGIAIQRCLDRGGTLLSPEPLKKGDPTSDPLLTALMGGERCEYDPSIPNQFRAHVSGPEIAAECCEAIFEKWHALSNAVRAHFFSSFDPETRKIWDEQIGSPDKNFWEMIWVCGPTELSDEDSVPDARWLAGRKRWRRPTWLGDNGTGDRCMLMPMFRELSGQCRSIQSHKQKAFWEALAETIDPRKDSLDLRPDERLSAPALVKRLFPRLPIETLEAIIGWRAPSTDHYRPNEKHHVRYWTSTHAMAARHWIHSAMDQASAECDTLMKSARALSLKHAVAERRSRLWPRTTESVSHLDGKLLFEGTLKGQAEFEREIGESDFAERFAAFNGALSAVRTTLRKKGRATSPSRYFAILRMDGDEVGKAPPGQLFIIQKKLGEFNAFVRATFCNHEGPQASGIVGDVLYAGGDDLLVMLPIEDALDAAQLCRAEFCRLFDNLGATQTGLTISASLVFAPATLALSWVIRESESLLDDFAKNQNGRNSLAIKVMRYGGAGPFWLGKWDNNTHSAIDDMKELLTRSIEYHAPWATNRYLHALEQRLGATFKHPELTDDRAALSEKVFETFAFAIASDMVTRDNAQWKKHVKEDATRVRRVTYSLGGGSHPSLNGLAIVKFLREEWRKK